MLENIFNILFVLIGVTIFVGITIRIMRTRFVGIKQKYAVVIDKKIIKKQEYYKNQAPDLHNEHYVVFLSDGKKMSFRISKLSYNCYQVGQSGMLKYKGSRIIDFKCIKQGM